MSFHAVRDAVDDGERGGQGRGRLQFTVYRSTGMAARRALPALGGNGTLRASNRAWSHSPTEEVERALEMVDRELIDRLPSS